MSLMQIWFMKADAHYELLADESSTEEPKLNCTCAEFFADPSNPFDQPIEELMEECNA